MDIMLDKQQVTLLVPRRRQSATAATTSSTTTSTSSSCSIFSSFFFLSRFLLVLVLLLVVLLLLIIVLVLLKNKWFSFLVEREPLLQTPVLRRSQSWPSSTSAFWQHFFTIESNIAKTNFSHCFVMALPSSKRATYAPPNFAS